MRGLQPYEQPRKRQKHSQTSVTTRKQPAEDVQWKSIVPEGGPTDALADDPIMASTFYEGTNSGDGGKITDEGYIWATVNTGLAVILNRKVMRNGGLNGGSSSCFINKEVCGFHHITR